MDPLSIATAVVGLTATCLSTCKKLHDLAGEYGDVPIIIAAICSESTIIGIGLSELQTKILQRDDLSQAWASRTEIWAAFEMALTGCMVVFNCLEAETRHLQSKNSGVWAKIKFMWNQDRFKELLAQLRGQQTSITFLLKLLEMDTLSSIQKDIRQNARKIQDTAAEAQSLRSRTASIKMRTQSIFDNDTTRPSFFEFEIVSGIAPSELDFEFDDVVVNSKVYRRELHKAKAKNQGISTPETADGDPDPDTANFRGNNPPLSFEGRQYIDSVNNGSFDSSIDMKIREKHDAYLEQIYQVGSHFLSGFENSLSDALQYRATGKDLKAAFESWKLMLDSALCLFIHSERLLTPEAAHASFVKFAKKFCQSLAQPVSGHNISALIIARDMTALLGSIFKSDIDVLLKWSGEYAFWENRKNTELDEFLYHLSGTDSPRFPRAWAIEPTSADEQSLICKECHQSLDGDDGKGMYMRGPIFDISSARDRWHPNCVPCHLCNKSVSSLVGCHVGNLASFKCDQESCGFRSQFFFVPHYYQIVCSMWLSWSVVV